MQVCHVQMYGDMLVVAITQADTIALCILRRDLTLHYNSG